MSCYCREHTRSRIMTGEAFWNRDCSRQELTISGILSSGLLLLDKTGAIQTYLTFIPRPIAFILVAPCLTRRCIREEKRRSMSEWNSISDFWMSLSIKGQTLNIPIPLILLSTCEDVTSHFHDHCHGARGLTSDQDHTWKIPKKSQKIPTSRRTYLTMDFTLYLFLASSQITCSPNRPSIPESSYHAE